MKKKILYVGNKLASKGNTTTGIDSLGPALEKEGFAVRYASDFSFKSLRLIHMLFAVIRFARRADYVLIDTYSTANFWYAFAVARLCQNLKIKYIPILHGGNLPQRLVESQAPCQLLFKNAYKNVAPSSYLQEKFSEAGYQNLIHIPNAIDIRDYPYKKRAHALRPHLLWVRSFAAIYNPILALEVFELLVEEYPEARLCMVGPDKDGSRSICEAYASEKKLSVTFTGKLEKKDWISLSPDFDIFINTTNFDNMPVSMLEAMALGFPIVSTHVGGIPYMLEDGKNAMLVPPNDKEAFTGAVRQLLRDSSKAEALSKNARSFAEQKDWSAVKYKWFKLLE